MRFIPQTKLGKIFFGVVIIVFLAFLASLALDSYRQYKGEKRVEELANELKRLADLDLQKKTADTIGGKTPQETLELFISAVEKGDYELASKYFVIEKYGEARGELLALEKNNNLNMYLDILKKAKPDGEIENGRFRMRSKLEVGPPDYFIDFILYPSGNWKIEEI